MTVRMTNLKCNALLLFCIICTSTFTIVFVLFTNLDRCQKVGVSPQEVVTSTHLEKKDRKTYFLVIFILSSPKNVERRNILRNTWLQMCPDNVKHFFVVGTKLFSKDERVQIESEYNSYQDIVLVETVQNSYNFLTQKVLEAFVWLNKNVNFQYVLKCDDDTFVNVGELVGLIHAYENDTGLYMGFFSGHGTVQKGGKWRENKWILCDYYLPYALGGGYVLSHHLINYIAKNSNDLLLLQSEDVSVGVWLANKANVNRVHSPFFDTEFRSRGCSNSYIVTHKHNELEQKQLYRNLKITGKLCEKEFQSRLSYIYNWTVPPSRCCARSDRTIP